jgi:proteasome component ECM29
LQIAIREAKRQNKDYQQFAIPTLGTVAASFSTVTKTDWHKEVVPIVEPVIEDMVSSYLEKMDVDGRDAYLEDKRREKTLVGCIESLEKSFVPAVDAASSGEIEMQTGLVKELLTYLSELDKRLSTVLNLILRISVVRLRGIELAIFTCLESLFGKLDTLMASSLKENEIASLAEPINKLLFQYDANGYMETIRLQRAKALVALSQVPNSALVGKAILSDAVESEIEKDPSNAIKELLQRVSKS